MDEYFSAAQESWVAWGFNSLVKKPLSFTAGLVFGSNTDTENVRYVKVELVKTKAAEVLARAQSGILSSSVLDLPTFKELFGDIVPDYTIPVVNIRAASNFVMRILHETMFYNYVYVLFCC